MNTKHQECDYHYCDICGDMYMTVGTTVIGMAMPMPHVYVGPKKPGREYICPKHRRKVVSE